MPWITRCSLCGANFSSPRQLTAHSAIHYDDTKNKRRTYCYDPDGRGYMFHDVTYRPDNTAYCARCMANLTNVETYTQHGNTPTGRWVHKLTITEWP